MYLHNALERNVLNNRTIDREPKNKTYEPATENVLSGNFSNFCNIIQGLVTAKFYLLFVYLLIIFSARADQLKLL